MVQESEIAELLSAVFCAVKVGADGGVVSMVMVLETVGDVLVNTSYADTANVYVPSTR